MNGARITRHKFRNFIQTSLLLMSSLGILLLLISLPLLFLDYSPLSIWGILLLIVSPSLLRTHPDTEQRIERLLEFGNT
jgi:Zn-dependent protease with chaperone function